MRLSRSLLVAVVALGLVAPVASFGLRPAVADTDSLRVYVIVADGLDPEEVTPELMPNVSALKGQSTWYEEARAVFPAETLPNHAAMMTGVLPARNGIVANQAWDRRFTQQAKFYVQLPRYFTTDTLTTRLETACPEVSTATVLSKTYLWRVFGEEYSFDAETPQIAADLNWNPQPVIPQSDHTLDVRTMDAFTDWTNKATGPQFAFVNLGDIDRAGHADPSGALLGGGMSKFRQSAMKVTDQLIGDFVQGLKDAEVWDNSVVIVASDHSMDWSTPDHGISIRDYIMTNSPYQGGSAPSNDFMFIHNGASELVYLHDGKEDLTVPIVNLLKEHEGIEHVIWEGSTPSLSDYGLDAPNFGADIVALTKPGWRFDEQQNSTGGNPLPGNHGNAITQQTTLMVTGGSDLLAAPSSVEGEEIYTPGQMPSLPQGGPGNLSIAPTVGMLFGLEELPGGYDGGPLLDAFNLEELADYQGPCAAPAAGTSTAPETSSPLDRWRYVPGTSNNRTSYSDGTGNPKQVFAAGKDEGLGFMATTDRTDFASLVNPVPDPYCEDVQRDCVVSISAGNRWERTAEAAHAASDRDFRGIRGWQWASNYQGFISVLLGEGFKTEVIGRDGGSAEQYEEGPMREQRDMGSFWSWLIGSNSDPNTSPENPEDDGGLAIFNHPGQQGSAWVGNECAPSAQTALDRPNVFEDFAYVAGADPFVVGADVFSSASSANDLRYESCFRRALSKGWHVGAFAGAERLSEWGAAGTPVAVLMLEDGRRLSARSVSDTLLARRFYASREPDLKLDLSADGLPMGSRLQSIPGSAVQIDFTIADDPSGLTVELVDAGSGAGTGRAALLSAAGGMSAASWQVLAPDLDVESWYYVRVLRDGVLVAVTSPIWVAGTSIAP